MFIWICSMHSNGALAGPDLVGGGGGCSCMLLLHPTPTCPEAGLVLCSHLVLVLLSFHQLAQILHLHMWWSTPVATCTMVFFHPSAGANAPLAHLVVITHCNLCWWCFSLPATASCTYTTCTCLVVPVIACGGASGIFVAVVVVYSYVVVAVEWW